MRFFPPDFVRRKIYGVMRDRYGFLVKIKKCGVGYELIQQSYEKSELDIGDVKIQVPETK